jgi:hypothetical protein
LLNPLQSGGVHIHPDMTTPCALQIDLRLIALNGGLGDTGLSAHQLRFERLDLSLPDLNRIYRVAADSTCRIGYRVSSTPAGRS